MFSLSVPVCCDKSQCGFNTGNLAGDIYVGGFLFIFLLMVVSFCGNVRRNG